MVSKRQRPIILGGERRPAVPGACPGSSLISNSHDPLTSGAHKAPLVAHQILIGFLDSARLSFNISCCPPSDICLEPNTPRSTTTFTALVDVSARSIQVAPHFFRVGRNQCYILLCTSPCTCKVSLTQACHHRHPGILHPTAIDPGRR